MPRRRRHVRNPRRDRRGRRHQAARRIEHILDAVRGRGRDDLDRRDHERGPRARHLDLLRDGQLFDRLAALDFEYLLSLDFAAGLDTLRLLLPQSVLGRAQNGHGFWRDEVGTPLVFRDATFDRVLTALEKLDPQLTAPRVRQLRGERLERLGQHLLAHVSVEEMPLEDADGPLMGVEFLGGQRVVTRDFLRGLLLAGWMDDLDRRLQCMAYHRRTFAGDALELGGGRTFVVRPVRLAEVGIVDPGRGEFAPEDIARLIELEVIAPVDREYARPEFEQAYFRMRTGEGVCDDLALMWIGARHGWDAYLGAFLMDAVDTYDKFLWRFRPGGVDGRLAAAIQERWQQRWGQPLVTDREILDVIRFGAKLNDPPAPLSSSHRRFIQTESGSKVPTLINHWRFLAGEPVFEIELGYQRFPSRKFYEIARNRFEILQIDIPETSWVAPVRRRR
jgi:hypothetical protein